MKKNYSLILTICIAITLFACKKDKNNESPNDLNGTWELAETSSAMMPVKTHDPGNGNRISFTNDKYAFYANGQVVKEGTYSIVDDNTVEENVCLINLKDTFKRRLIYDNDTVAPKIFIYISDGKLSLMSGCYAVDAGHKEVYRHIINIID